MKAASTQQISARKGPDGNRAVPHNTGHNEHRSGNPIEAAYLFFLRGFRFGLGAGGVLGRLRKAATTVANAMRALPTMVGSVCIFFNETHGRVSKAALCLLPLFLTGCELKEEFPATVAELAGLDPWVAVALVLRGPLYFVAMAFMVKGFTLIKITRKGDYTEIQRADEEEEA